jgi:alkaline phosphatase D
MSTSPTDAIRRRLMLASSLAPVAGMLPTPAQAAAGTRRLRIGFGSCARQNKPQPIWNTIAQARPDLFLFLGDNLYADAKDEATLRQRYEEFRALGPLQDFRKQFAHAAIWDDHDFGDDDVGGEYPFKKLSQQLFCDAWAVPDGSPRRKREGVYDSFFVPVGDKRVQIIMMDLRYNRTALVSDPRLKQDYRLMVLKAKTTGQPMTGWYVPNPDPSATLLGDTQWAWLEEQLRLRADLRVLVSSIQFGAEGTGWENWSNFPHDRQRLVRLLHSTRAEGVVVISGDMHYADLSRWQVDGGYPLWDLTSSGLTEVWDVPTPNQRRVSPVVAEVNFGLLDIDFDAAGGQVTLGIRDLTGTTRISETVALSSLRFA